MEGCKVFATANEINRLSGDDPHLDAIFVINTSLGCGLKGESYGFADPNFPAAGVLGVAHGHGSAGLHGGCDNGPGIFGIGNPAGKFQGDVQVTGDITFINQDCAEEFDLSTTDVIDPGTVMVLNQSDNLEQSHQSYDKKVTGIVSGAGNFKPALVLDKTTTGNKRVPIALMGKVYCKVDATCASIEIGDLLTTSPTRAGRPRRPGTTAVLDRIYNDLEIKESTC